MPSTTDADGSTGLNWAYLGVSAATLVAGAAVGACVGVGLSAAGLTTVGGGFLWSAVLGALALLAYLGATTGERGQMAEAAAEPMYAMADPLGNSDFGFAVNDAMLWVALGLLAAGLGGMAYAF